MFFYLTIDKVYFINSCTNELKIVCKKEMMNSYHFIDNSKELLISSTDGIIIYNNSCEKKIEIKSSILNNILDVTKDEDNGYFILKSTKVYYLKNEEIKEYNIPEIILSQTLSFQNEAIIYFFNKKLYYTHFMHEEIDQTIVKVKLGCLDLETGDVIEKIIFEKTYEFDIIERDIFKVNLIEYKGSIIWAISVNKNTLLVKYNINNDEFVEKTIDQKLIRMDINDDMLILSSNTYSYEQKFILYDISKFCFIDYLTINEKPPNGYLDIFLSNNKFFIITYECKNDSKLLIFEKNTNIQKIKLGALALKYFCKEKLNIEFGQYQDIKEQILNKMNTQTILENDKVISCKILDNNFHIVSTKFF